MVDSEEDEEVTQSSQGGGGRTQQVYDIDSDEGIPVQSARPPPRARNHGGPSKVEHEGADNHNERHNRHDSGRRGTSQALVRREPSLSDEEPGPSRGHRGGNKSKKASTTRGYGKQQASDDEETVTVERFRLVEWRELCSADIDLITNCLNMTRRKLREHCEEGKIRYDRKSNFFDFELMYPFFPPHLVNRFEDELKKVKKSGKERKKMDEAARGGRTIVETRLLVPTYLAYEPYDEPNYELDYELYRAKHGGDFSYQEPSPWSRGHLGYLTHNPNNPYCDCMHCEL